MPDPTTQSLQEGSVFLTRFAHLEAKVEHLTEIIEPLVLAQTKDELRKTILQEMGITEPTTGVRPVPGSGMLKSMTDAAATTGGGRLIAGLVVSILGVTAPGVLEVAADFYKAGQVITTVSAPESLPDAAEEAGPPLPDYRGLQDDSPVQPRPSL